MIKRSVDGSRGHHFKVGFDRETNSWQISVDCYHPKIKTNHSGEIFSKSGKLDSNDFNQIKKSMTAMGESTAYPEIKRIIDEYNGSIPT